MNVDNQNAEELSPEEELYTSTKAVYDSMSCMTVTDEKVKIYKSLAAKFQSIEEYEDAKELAAKCEQLAEETHVLVGDTKLKQAEAYMANVKSANDLKKAERLLKDIKDYKNAKELSEQCKVAYNRLLNKRKHRVYVLYGVIVLAVVLFVCSRTNLFKYQTAKVLENVGQHNMAAKIFDGLNEYKDSEEYMEQCYYEAGKAMVSKDELTLKDYQKAKDTLMKAQGYKDSSQLIADVEKGILQYKEVGDKITFNGTKWIVVEKLEDKALMVKEQGIEELSYSNHDRAVTWDTSYLRQYLNSIFLEENFTKEEQANIVDTKLSNEANAKYETTGGNDTIDKIFVLSVDELRKYNKLEKSTSTKDKPVFVLNKQGNNSWLRTPGASENSVAFQNVQGDIMEYGYAADSKELLPVPAFWYEY